MSDAVSNQMPTIASFVYVLNAKKKRNRQNENPSDNVPLSPPPPSHCKFSRNKSPSLRMPPQFSTINFNMFGRNLFYVVCSVYASPLSPSTNTHTYQLIHIPLQLHCTFFYFHFWPFNRYSFRRLPEAKNNTILLSGNNLRAGSR